MSETTKITVKIAPDLEAQLQAQADQNFRTLSGEVRAALTAWIEPKGKRRPASK